MGTIKVKIIDQNTLCLEEDAKKGDIIDLTSAISVDTSFIQRLIEENKNKYIEEKIKERELILKENFKKDLQLKINDLETEQRNILIEEKQKINDQVEKLKNENIRLEEALKNQKNNDQLTFNSQLERKNSEIQMLKNDIANIKQNIELQITQAKDNVTKEYNEKLSNKNIEIEKLKGDIKSFDANLTSELLKKENEIKTSFEEQIAQLKEENENLNKLNSKLNLDKSTLNVKHLGENLEKWCTEEYENAAIAGFINCTWEKDNVVIKDGSESKGTKADFIFKVFSDAPENCTYPISSVCLEMKNESNVSVNKKKNSDYYKKLDEDRKKKDCEYALLVSELEWDSANDSPIKKVSGYDKMFVVRPQYMITFLSLIYSLSTKYSSIINSERKHELNLKSSQDLINEFEHLKKTYIEKPIESLTNQVKKLNENNDKIIKAANDNKELISKIINETLDTIKIKIERFNINKLARKLDEIND